MTMKMTMKRLWIGCSAIAIAVLAGCSSDPEPVWQQTFTKVYCYRTLADADCHTQPQPRAGRLIAVAPHWSYTPK